MMQIKANFWVERGGGVALSRWRVALLRAVEETGSITAGAERMKVPYRRAWDKIRESEERLGAKLLLTKTGGAGGGGAQLTPLGAECVRRFEQFCQGLDDVLNQRFAEAFEGFAIASDRDI